MPVDGIVGGLGLPRELSPGGRPILEWPPTEDFGSLLLSQHLIEPIGDREVRVRGDSMFQQAILAAVGGRHRENVDTGPHTALLLPEPWNRYDPRSVRVFLRTGLCGYLARADARKYLPVIELLAQRGKVAACRAMVTSASADPADGSGRFGVSLYLGAPGACIKAITAKPPVPRSIPAGWYPYRGGHGELRYWDGARWTGHVTPGLVGGEPARAE